LRAIPIVNGEKRCTGCQKTKPLAEFTVRADGKRKGQIEANCKQCFCERSTRHRIAAGEAGLAKRNADHARRRTERAPVIPFVPSMRVNFLRDQKWCGSCRKTKPHNEFAKKLSKGDGSLCSHCKECSSKNANEWYLDNTERALANDLTTLLRRKVVFKLGSRCANPFCLVVGGCADLRALQIDHVNNDGAEERKKYGGKLGPRGGQTMLGRTKMRSIYQLALEDTEGRYQLLCANCNVIKEYERRQEKYRQRKEARLAAS